MEYDVGRRMNRPLAMMLTLCGALAIITLVSASLRRRRTTCEARRGSASRKISG